MSDPRKHTDSELWLSFANGNKNAFSAFYEQNYEKLYSYGVNLGMEPDQIRDIIQELFIKLYTKPQLIKEVSTIQSFLFVSVRNAFVNQEKRRKKHFYYQEVENYEFPYTVENTKIEDEEELKLIKEKVEKVISILTPRQREMIYLRFLHQMEYEEIAKIMNLSEQAARNLTYRALEKARKSDKDFIILLFLLQLLSNH